jgi:glycosyltransferase involved in cell wall biosynthesis
MESGLDSIVIDRLANLGRIGKTSANEPLTGTRVYDARLAEAILRYGSLEHVYYLQESLSGPQKEAQYPNAAKLRPLHLGNIEGLRRRTGPLLLLTAGHHLGRYVPMRQFLGRPEWPICGITHGLATNSLIPAYAWLLCSRLNRHDAIICATDSARRALQSILAQLAESSSLNLSAFELPIMFPVIPHGTEITAPVRRNNAPNTFTVVNVGRFNSISKADLRPIIGAFLQANDLPPGSTLLIVGDDSRGESAALAEFTQKIESPHRVVLVPNAPEDTKRRILAMADAALCLSDTMEESYGLAVAEAMMNGLPVVAPAWNGYRELIQHGETGFLASTTFVGHGSELISTLAMFINPGFTLGQRVVIDTGSLIRSLAELANNHELRLRMGERAREVALQRFAWSVVIKQYEELWREQVAIAASLICDGAVNRASWFDYGTAFAHYAENQLADRQHLARTEADPTEMTSPPLAGFDTGIDTAIRDALHDHESTAFSDLIAAVDPLQERRAQVATQVARMLKYGLLCMCNAGGVSPLSLPAANANDARSGDRSRSAPVAQRSQG